MDKTSGSHSETPNNQLDGFNLRLLETSPLLLEPRDAQENQEQRVTLVLSGLPVTDTLSLQRSVDRHQVTLATVRTKASDGQMEKVSLDNGMLRLTKTALSMKSQSQSQ